MILLIDNYDSFTFNLYQYLGELGQNVQVIRNDQITIEEIRDLKPKAIILSPGPGRPENAGITIEAIQTFFDKVPILGICLGHQAIGAAFGAKIKGAKHIKHGKSSFITHDGMGLFAYLSSPLEVMRYHSLSIDLNTMPIQLKSIAKSMEDQEIMAVKHTDYPVYGLQFHPESIGTPEGKKILYNFIHEIEGIMANETLFTPIS